MLRVVAVQTAIVAVAVRATTESERQQWTVVGRVTPCICMHYMYPLFVRCCTVAHRPKTAIVHPVYKVYDSVHSSTHKKHTSTNSSTHSTHAQCQRSLGQA